MAGESIPPSLRAELAELDRKLYELERRQWPGGGSGTLMGTRFHDLAVNPALPGNGAIGSVAVTITKDGSGELGLECASGYRGGGFVPLYPAAD